MGDSFYSNYVLDKNILCDTSNDINSNKVMSEKKGVLKSNYTLTKSDYEKINDIKQNNKIYENSYLTNKRNYEIYENNKVFNFLLANFIQKSSYVYVQLINELTLYMNDENRNINKLGYILTKNENLIFIGILVLFIAFCLWLVDITS